jgi:hypothetical protein
VIADPEKRLAAAAESRMSTAGVLAQVRQFREQLYALLRARIENAPPPERANAALRTWIQEAWRDLRFDIKVPGNLSWDAARAALRRKCAVIAVQKTSSLTFSFAM